MPIEDADESPSRDDATRELQEDGFWKLLEMVPIPGPENSATKRVRLEVGPQHLRSLGMMHGGVAASLLDSVMGRAALQMSPKNFHVVTIQLGIQFIRPARQGDTLVGEADVQHSGSMTAVVRGELRNQEGLLIATGSGTFMHLPLRTEVHEERDRGNA